MTNYLKFLICIIIPLLLGCGNTSDDIIFDETKKVYQLYDTYVDEYGNKGVVVHCEYDSYHGSIIVVSADEAYLPWGPLGETVYQIEDTLRFPQSAYGDDSFGTAMLHLMKCRGIENYPAMNWCNKKNPTDKPSSSSSWRLPTRKEVWDCLVINTDLDELNAVLSKIGGVPLNEENFYWTCAEDYCNYNQEGVVNENADPSNMAIVAPLVAAYDRKDGRLKKKSYYVRAIKYIYLEEYY